LGGLSIGAWSFGGVAFGWQAFGGCAIAWNAAVGGAAALAHDFAHGGTAYANQANTEAVRAYLGTQVFFRNAAFVFQYMAWLNLIWVLPMIAWWR
jgi:hypothetical protein